MKELENNGLRECDAFILLTADYDIICERNITRNHKLEGIWINEKTIKMQRNVLENMTNEVIGIIGNKGIKKKILDTTYLSKEEVYYKFNNIVNNLNRDEKER